MTLQQLAEWSRRSQFPSVANAALGWGAEYWDDEPTHYEAWSDLRALGRAEMSGHRLAYALSSNLLRDVLVAAGGVEHAIEALRSAVADLAKWVSDEGLKADAGISLGLAHDAAAEAWYSFADVISWSRILEERLDRPPFQKKGLRNQGLVPALKPAELSKRVGTLLNELRSGPLGETRFLTNFTLHSSLVKHPFSGAQLLPSGQVALHIPDVQTKPISHWDMLTWEEHRDGIAFAEELWTSIQNFIDELLAVFEQSVPSRLQRVDD